MIWMNILGKIYHCTECNYSFKINYKPIDTKNGPVNKTFVDEQEIGRWIILHQKYNSEDDIYLKDINKIDDSTDYLKSLHIYLHDEVICHDCLNEVYKKDPLLARRSQKYNEALNIINNIKILGENYFYEIAEKRTQILSHIISSIFLEDFKETKTDAYQNTIGSKFFKLKNKRKALINQYLESARKEVVEKIFNLLIEHDEIKYFIDNFKLYTKDQFEKLHSLKNDQFNLVFEEIDISQPETFFNRFKYVEDNEIERTDEFYEEISPYRNLVLMGKYSEFVIREPEMKPKEKPLYRLTKVDGEELIKEIDELGINNVLQIDENELVEIIRKRLYEVAGV